jgi:hypothetical protein
MASLLALPPEMLSWLCEQGMGQIKNPVADVPPSTVPGVYVAVPPNNFMYGSLWGNMQLFSLEANDQFRPSPPPPLSSPTYARDLNEIKAVGELNSTVRTPDQTAYAKWWFELSDIGWNRIAIIQATNHDMGLYATARMFALLNMAMADAYISSFNAKYYYYTWRPYTAIRAAGTDGNDRTEPDPDWEPLIATPPVPDYPSTHCTLGNASAAVLAYFFGNHSPFTSTSTTSATPGETRSFKSFKEAADENASSRIMVGIHFRFACDAGQKMGDKVGAWTVKNHLEPLINFDKDMIIVSVC